MSISDLTRFTQDSRRAGENIARTIRLVAKLLSDWSIRQASDNVTVDGDNLITPDKPLPPLKAVEFDKLSTLFCRLWNELYERKKIRYRAAFSVKQGFHGPGTAIRIDRKADENLGINPDEIYQGIWAFVTEIVEILKPALGNTRRLFRIDGPSRDPRTPVYPTLEPAAWDSWISDIDSHDPLSCFLNVHEIGFMHAIGMSISQLDAEEIRALGTHCNASETCKDIAFNFRALKNGFDNMGLCLRDGKSEQTVGLSAHKMVVTAEEILRKSHFNKEKYGTAHNKFANHLRNMGSNGAEVLAVFDKVQRPGNEIWDDDFIVKVRGHAGILLDFCLYCRCGLLTYIAILKLTEREKKDAAEAYQSLHKFLGTKITIPDYTQMKSLAMSDWADVLKSIMNEIEKCLPSMEPPRLLGVPYS